MNDYKFHLSDKLNIQDSVHVQVNALIYLFLLLQCNDRNRLFWATSQVHVTQTVFSQDDVSELFVFADKLYCRGQLY